MLPMEGAGIAAPPAGVPFILYILHLFSLHVHTHTHYLIHLCFGHNINNTVVFLLQLYI